MPDTATSDPPVGRLREVLSTFARTPFRSAGIVALLEQAAELAAESLGGDAAIVVQHEHRNQAPLIRGASLQGDRNWTDMQPPSDLASRLQKVVEGNLADQLKLSPEDTSDFDSLASPLKHLLVSPVVGTSGKSAGICVGWAGEPPAGEPIRLFAESLACLCGQAIDHREQAAQAGGITEALRAAGDMASAPLAALSIDGAILWFNAAVAEQLGYVLEDVRGKRFWEVYAVDKEQKSLCGQIDAMRTSQQPDGHAKLKLTARRGVEREHDATFRRLEDGTLVLTLSVSENKENTTEDAGGGPANGRSQRREFRYRQQIGPIVEGRMPSEEDFVTVTFNDISRSGVSFFLPQPPEFTDLVVRLGRPPNSSQLRAEVVRKVETVSEGRKWTLVGCRFTGRADA